MIRRHFGALAALLLIANTASAVDSPGEVWVKAKCALCHGIDGSSQTERGKKLHAPDLRSPATQKLSDETLARKISSGHERMPSFDTTGAETVRLLVACIRGFAREPAAQAGRR